MVSDSLLALVKYVLTYEGQGATDEEQIEDWNKFRSRMEMVLPASLEREGLSLLGMGNMGIVINNGDGTCTKFLTVLAGEEYSPENNEVSNSLYAADLGLSPSIHSYEVLEEAPDGWIMSMTMDVLEGMTLFDYIQSGADWWTWVPKRLVELVSWMHQQDLVHKDLHRGNIWVTPDNDLMFIDWGLSSSNGGSDEDKSWDFVRSQVVSI